MTTTQTDFKTSYLTELTDNDLIAAPHVRCEFEGRRMAIPIRVTAMSETRYKALPPGAPAADPISDHEITITVVCGDGEAGLTKHLLDQQAQRAYANKNITTVQETVELIGKLQDLCDGPGVMMYSAGERLTELHGEVMVTSLLLQVIDQIATGC